MTEKPSPQSAAKVFFVIYNGYPSLVVIPWLPRNPYLLKKMLPLSAFG